MLCCGAPHEWANYTRDRALCHEHPGLINRPAFCGCPWVLFSLSCPESRAFYSLIRFLCSRPVRVMPVCVYPRLAGMATSQDGLAWEKKGPVFDGGPEGAFDEMGAGRRRIVMHNG